MPFTRDLPGNFGLRLDDAKKWLQTCLSGHFQCHATHNSPGKHKTLGLPTRLVEVLIVNDSLHARVRSFSDQDQLRLADQIRYLTLSHCWGAQPSSEPQKDLRLKSNNIDNLSRSIPIEELGQLFQDALYVTLHLGYQYIWIDSLCIVQDQIDKDDWEYEAHRMADYYDNSVLTIMASAAKDGNDRLFPSQKLKSLPFPVVNFATPEMNKFARKRAVPLTTFWTGEQPAAETIRAHEQHDEFYVVDLYSWSGLADGPLADRAWVLQEELSSKRILYFGNDQMYWECGMTASETWPVGFPKSMSTLVDGRRIRKNIQYLAEADTESNPKDKDTARFYSSVWFQIIEEYTRRRLSFDSDRLPAIWGIMDRIGKYIEDRDIHGFRASDLIRSLLWRENPLDARLTNPDIGRAPSWSWASLNSQVSWPHWLLTAQEEPYMLFKPDWKDKTDRRVLVAKGPLRSIERNQLCTNSFGACSQYSNSLITSTSEYSFLRAADSSTSVPGVVVTNVSTSRSLVSGSSISNITKVTRLRLSNVASAPRTTSCIAIAYGETIKQSTAYWRFKDWLKTNLYENEYLERHNNGDYVIHIR
ncbi:hypothetical protein SLS60_008851 [Paraconiothyrium brasiliense]|uniref:Heterokaryon incompatibility domain-containing protein n=1 Tax=Paraconiothyrium brasiliense TaxID=300254 RepID=A0ABR3QZT2_9PLEO